LKFLKVIKIDNTVLANVEIKVLWIAPKRAPLFAIGATKNLKNGPIVNLAFALVNVVVNLLLDNRSLTQENQKVTRFFFVLFAANLTKHPNFLQSKEIAAFAAGLARAKTKLKKWRARIIPTGKAVLILTIMAPIGALNPERRESEMITLVKYAVIKAESEIWMSITSNL
jgi:hypothetical protein